MDVVGREHTTMSRPVGGSKNNGLKRPKEEISVKYMHRPPLITPNYGNQRKKLLPKSKVPRVLLYDNATQDHMLDIKLAHINIEKERICRIINLHKKSFSARMQKKHMVMQQNLTTKFNTPSSPNDKPIQNDGTHETVTSSPRAPEGSPQLENGDEEKPLLTEEVNTELGHLENMKINENPDRLDENRTPVDINDIKLPNIDNDKRHVIFKMKDKEGKTKVYHTVGENGVLSDIIPMHSFYDRLVDDPRFKSLQNLLVPFEKSPSPI